MIWRLPLSLRLEITIISIYSSFLKQGLTSLVLFIKHLPDIVHDQMDDIALAFCDTGKWMTLFMIITKGSNSSSGKRMTLSLSHCSRKAAAFFTPCEKGRRTG